MLNRWDSWFGMEQHKGKNFWYNDRLFSGAEVNYIVGGYAFRELGYTSKEMENRILQWKNKSMIYTFKSRSFTDLRDTFYWAYKVWFYED